MPKPQYSGEHERVRAALVAAYSPGQLCPICRKPMFGPARSLDLAHKVDELGRRTGGWSGLAHAKCNRADNAWNWRGRQAQADAQRSPQDTRERNARASRRAFKDGRRAFDEIQRLIAAGEPLPPAPEEPPRRP
jgi:hypothetical protein